MSRRNARGAPITSLAARRIARTSLLCAAPLSPSPSESDSSFTRFSFLFYQIPILNLIVHLSFPNFVKEGFNIVTQNIEPKE